VVVKPTRPLVLLAAAVVAGVLSFGGIQVWADLGTLPGVPASAPITPAILAAIILATALAFRSRLQAQREAIERVRSGEPTPPLLPGQRASKPVDPLQAARAAMFAKASSMVGSIVAGIYGGYGLYLLFHIEVDVYKGRAVVCGLAVLAGVALVAAALFLEYVLRVPPIPPDDPTSLPPKSKVDGKASTSKRPVRRPENPYPVRRGS
jgi:Protein of unknown function (DUF3180)